MPIYEYRCSNCGFEKEYLRKLSDPPLSDCPQCSKATFSKKVTAAGFQLKGGGWYATDFKGSPKIPASQSEGKDSASNGSAASKESSGNKESTGAKETSASKDSSSSKASADNSSSASKEPTGSKQTSGSKESAGSKEPV